MVHDELTAMGLVRASRLEFQKESGWTGPSMELEEEQANQSEKR
jgi:hypothetical protein